MSTQRMMNDAPGFLCPACENFRIKVSLDAFLSQREVVCACCGTPFHMDKSRATHFVGLLQDLNVAQKNLQALQNQNL